MVDIFQEHNYASGGKKKKKKKSSGSIFDNAFSGINAIFGGRNQMGSVAESIEKQAAAQKRAAEKKASEKLGPGSDPFQMLQDQLFGAMNSIDVAPTPLEQLQKMAISQVGAQYDPQIEALAREMASHERRGNQSQKTARDMYGALSKDYISQLPAMTEQFAAEDAATGARYDDAQNVLKEQYGDQAADQEKVLKDLGIQAASQESSQQAKDDQAYFQNQLEVDQNQAQNALDEQQMAAQTYQRDLGNNAKMAGENTAQDIASQLRDYLDQAEGQLGSLKSQRSSAISALVAQMQQQDAQRVEEQRQSEMDNLMKLFNFQLSATNSSMNQQNKAAKLAQAAGLNGSAPFKGTSGLQGASNYLASQYPDQPILASNLMEQLNDVLSNKDVVNGKFVLDKGDSALGKGPTYSNVGQEYMMDLLRREFEKEGSRYNTGDINATMNALLAYMGKLR